MDLVEQHADRSPTGQDPVALLATIQKDAARRSARYEAVFDEIAKTLGLLSNHRLLHNDAQFAGLLDALTGVEDAMILNDRVLALVAYVNRVAQAHGVTPTAATNSTAHTIIMQQRPKNLADPDDDFPQRTRLQVR